MPKIVDHELIKIRIAEATWKIIVQEGLENATVRNIARESGMSAGSLRHYFPSQADLLLYSMELVSERVTQRIDARRATHEKKLSRLQVPSPMDCPTEGPLMTIVDVLSQLLPLDEERRVETEVWFVYSARALVDTRLQQLSHQVYADMQAGFSRIMRLLRDCGLTRDDVQFDLEVNRLLALVDGMALHHLLHPDQFTYQDMIDTLRYHLRSLCK